MVINMIDPKKIKEIIAKISSDDIIYLWEIGQEHDYASIRQARNWNLEDEFWRQVGYEMRKRG